MWYENSAVGKEKLRTFLSSMCAEAGIRTEGITNHSLRATGTTAMFAANVPEKIIRSVTGHRSTALQLYERPTEEQQKSVSNLLVGGNSQESSQMPCHHDNVHQQSVSLTRQLRSPLHQIQPSSAPVFSGLSGCTISNLVVHVHQAPVSQYEEYQELVKRSDVQDK